MYYSSLIFLVNNIFKCQELKTKNSQIRKPLLVFFNKSIDQMLNLEFILKI
jgi:hypothetical protein